MTGTIGVISQAFSPIDNERQLKEFYLTLAAVDCADRNKAGWIANVMTWFKAEYILDPFLRHVFQRVLELQQNGEPVVRHTIIRGLVKDSRQYGTRIQEAAGLLLDRTRQGGHIEYYARDVYTEHRRRAASQDIAQTAEDVANPINDPDDVLSQLPEIASKYAPPPIDRNADNKLVMQDIIAEMEGKREHSNFQFGIASLDNLVGGVPRGALVVIGARTSNGKTVMLGQTALKCANRDGKVALMFSLEMAQGEMYKRFASVISRQPVKGGNRQRFLGGLARVDQMLRDNLLQVFTGPRTVEQIVAEATVYASRCDVGVICVDYLQAVVPAKSRNDNREQQVAHIAASLKHLASQTGIPVLTATQLNKGGEKTPHWSNVRESEAIANYANILLLLDPDDSPGSNVNMDIYIAKNRDGAKDVVTAVWERPLFTIRETDAHDMDNYDPVLAGYPDDAEGVQKLVDQAARRQQENVNDQQAMQDELNGKR